MSKFYVTTPIYYVNDVPHIGHAYTTIMADTLARYAKLKGRDTYFLTGTDEHGQKIEQSAELRGKTPAQYSDEISAKFKNLWDEFEIGYDKFIRTTDADHKAGVQKAFETMHAKGDIFKGEYEGRYCVSCETFFTESQLLDGQFCPECGKPTSLLKEESYFFKLSAYGDKLLKWIDENPKAILPKSRRNEVIRFIEQGLGDLSITRTSFSWGVKLPDSINDPKHVVYVWLDALMNYVTALGYGKDNANMGYWPADYQLIGKDILRFHAIFWPAFLMSLELPLPRCVAAHGWWTRDGEKMSKSKGNVINPKEVADAYGLENFRYFMLREVPFGQDGDFAQKALIGRINNDLGNDLGNLLNRIIGMSHKYFEGNISSAAVAKHFQAELDAANEIIKGVDEQMSEVQLNRYLEEVWKIISIGNKIIETTQPWAKMKEGGEEIVQGLLGLVANLLAKTALLVSPVMPKTANKIAKALGFAIDADSFAAMIDGSKLLEDFVIETIPPLFPKIEGPLMPEAPQPTAKSADAPKEEPKKAVSGDQTGANVVGIEDFFKVQIKIGRVVTAEEVKKSDKLLLLQVDIGEAAPRQVVAGIKEFYAPADLVGKQVCLVANLKPAKLMGMLSEGMVLAAKDESGLTLIQPGREVVIGTQVK